MCSRTRMRGSACMQARVCTGACMYGRSVSRRPPRCITLVADNNVCGTKRRENEREGLDELMICWILGPWTVDKLKDMIALLKRVDFDPTNMNTDLHKRVADAIQDGFIMCFDLHM